MNQTLKNIRSILIYTVVLFVISAVYFVYAYFAYPVVEERETFLTELGEVFGKIGLVALLFIYCQSALKSFQVSAPKSFHLAW